MNFPNGGGGFSGYNGTSVHIPPIRRPSIAGTDPAYYRFSVIVAIVMFLLVYAHLRTRPGRAWAAIRQSEPAALAAGINTTFYKLWALALASFVTGVAGALLAGQDALPVLDQLHHPGLDHPARGGADGRRVQPVGRGRSPRCCMQLLPALLQNLGVSYAWLTILFGVGVLQVLTTAPAGSPTSSPRT